MIIYLFALLVSYTLSANENTNFTYDTHGDDWTGTCKTGKYQSPIKLKATAQNSDSFLFTDYLKTDAQINFFNTTTYFNDTIFGSVYTLTKDGRTIAFKATEMRLRCQSEHEIQDQITLESKKYALELQIFHTLLYPNSTNDRLAIGLLFEQDTQYEGDPFLQRIIDAELQNTKRVQVDLSQYLKKANNFDFWFYTGSLTLPYCTDNQLNWIVIKQPFKISTAQKKYFYDSFYNNKQIDGNWRKLQNNNNAVGFYSHLTDN